MRIRNAYLLGVLAGPALLLGNPEGARVVSGEASVHKMDQGTTHVHAAHGAIVEWQKFSIAEGETTRFFQPDSKSAVLNRVVGKEKSFLSGKLQANGKVYLINPHGILITKTGIINTAAFFAATHNLSDEEFLKQQELTFKGNSKASLVNLGTIEAKEGDVALIAHSVDNRGEIHAPQGEVFLGSGGEVILMPSGVDRMQIRLSDTVDKSEDVGVHHSGAIEAIRANLKADGNLCALAINQEGIVNATGVLEKDGQVFLVADHGSVQMTGSIAAHNTDGSGGQVRLLGDGVGLLGAASVDVSGENKGGTVLIGGDYQGNNPEIPNAQGVYVGEFASIDASATEAGDGGKVILWGDQSTAFFGTIKAEGGAAQGDGGFVEISSKGALIPEGKVSTKALHGKTGTLLLDPTDVNITSGADSNILTPPGPPPPPPPGGPYNYSFSASPANISYTSLQIFLNDNNVTVDSNNGPGGVGTITIIPQAAPLSYANNLSLISPQTIIFTLNGNTFANTGAGSLNVQAQDVTFDSPINYTSGTLTASASNILLVNQSMLFNNDVSLSGGTLDFIGSGVNVVTAGNLSLSGGTLNVTSTNSNYKGANCSISVGTLNLNGNNVNLGSNAGNLNVNVTGNINIAGNGGPDTLQTVGGVTSITAGGNIVLNGAAGLAQIIVEGSGSQAGNVIAGGSMTLKNGAQIMGTGPGTANLVVDNSSPRPAPSPGIGFNIDATSSITTGGPLLIYTTLPTTNNVVSPNATFNGKHVTLTGTTTCTPSNCTEIQGFSFGQTPLPAGANGDPVTFFYAGPTSLAMAQALIIATTTYRSPTSTSPAIQAISQNVYETLGYLPIVATLFRTGTFPFGPPAVGVISTESDLWAFGLAGTVEEETGVSEAGGAGETGGAGVSGEGGAGVSGAGGAGVSGEGGAGVSGEGGPGGFAGEPGGGGLGGEGEIPGFGVEEAPGTLPEAIPSQPEDRPWWRIY